MHTSSGELPYVMKKHWAMRLHDDLRLEWNGVLLSWALPEGAPLRVGETRPAIEMEDHSRANLLFEGVHTTGTIMVWERGSWRPHVQSGDVLLSLEMGFLRFTIRGERLRGVWTLSRIRPASSTRRAVWTLRKETDLPDASSDQRWLTEEQPTSVFTGRTKEKIVEDWTSTKRGRLSFLQMRFSVFFPKK